MDPHRPPHPNYTVPNAQHDVQDNVNATPAVEHPFVIPSFADSQAELSDVLMEDPGYDSMPGLFEFSDSDSESEANEVEMQAVDAGNNDDDRMIDNAIRDVLNPFIRPAPRHTPSSSSSNSVPNSTSNDNPRSNRRARVEDDDDEERDRRHPSQRVSGANNTSTSATSSFDPTSANSTPNQSATPTPPPPHARHHHPHYHHVFHAAIGIPRRQGDNPLLRFYQHVNPVDNNNNNGGNAPPAAGPSNANGNVSDQSNNNNNATPQTQAPPPQPQRPARPPQVFEGMAVFELGPGMVFGGPPPGPGDQPQGAPNANADGAQQPQPQQPNALRQPFNPNAAFTNLMANFLGGGDFDGNPININFNWGGLGLGQEKEDPERAKKLVDGLEEVPVGLVRRLERVGGSGGGMGEDTNAGGDAGCAICWDKLLDGDSEGFGKDKDASTETEDAATSTEDKAEGSSLSSSSSSKEERKYPKIVSLPCAHVFHADCLIPWFSRPRHTTCPTCRFNIDPDNLTYVSASRRRRRREQEQREREEAQRRGDAQPASAEGAGTNNTEGNGSGEEGAPNPAADLFGRLNEQIAQAIAGAGAVPPPVGAAGQTGATTPAGPATAPGTGAPRGPGIQTTTIQTPQGTVNVIQVPIPIVIPVQVPFAPGAGGQAGGVNGAGATPAPAPAQTQTPGSNTAAQAPQQLQPQAQAQGPQQQQQHGPSGEFARFLSHLFQHALGAGAGTPNGVVIGPINAIPPINTNGWQYMGSTIVGGGQPRGQAGQGQAPQPTQPQTQTQGATATGNGATPATQQGPTIIQPPMLPPTFLPGFPFHAQSQVQFPPQAANVPPVAAASDGNNNSNAAHPPPTTNDAPATAPQQPPGLPPPVNPFTPSVRPEMMRYTIDMIFNGPMPGLAPGMFGPPPGFVNAAGAGAQDGAGGAGGRTRPRANSLPPGLTFVEGQRIGPAPGQGDFGRMRDLDEILDLLADDELEEQEQADGAMAAMFAAHGHGQANAGGGQAQQPPQQQHQQQQGQGQGQQQGPQGPHIFHGIGVGLGLPPFLAGGLPGVHAASGLGRTVQEALAQVFAGFRQPQAQGPQPQPQPQPQAEGQQQPRPGGAPAQAQPQQQQQVPPAGGNGLPPLPPNIPQGMRMFTSFSDFLGGGASERDNRPKRTWTLPPPPGPTLRQRIERKEREAGLRCFDISCGIGPSDEEPNTTEGGKQVSIKSQADHGALVCGHTFHSACLVSAERVALSAKGAEDVVETEDGRVEVSCPICRGIGCVSREEWEEGVVALA